MKGIHASADGNEKNINQPIFTTTSVKIKTELNLASILENSLILISLNLKSSIHFLTLRPISRVWNLVCIWKCK
jgi:hypothetical protein